ncbi:RNA methyltransferase [bacterium]|nr:RNA methyltransferase [bacterium]
MDVECIYGRQPVQLFLQKSPRRSQVLWLDRKLDAKIRDRFTRLARGRSVAVRAVDRGQIDRITGRAVHQGVALETEPLAVHGLSKLFSVLGRPGLVLAAIDGVTDPQNFGAVCRSAEAFGLDGILFEPSHSPPLGGAVYKASAGAVEFLNLYGVDSLPDALRKIKTKGVRLVGLDASGPSALTDQPSAGATCWILGSEDRGLRPGVRSVCDAVSAIPMRGRVGSLNVSAAAAVAFFFSRKCHL